MKIDFLGASDGTPLSKTFEEIAPGTYRTESYPHVLNFVSVEQEVNSLQEFFVRIQAAAREGMCLLKGKLDKQLVNESRARHTNPAMPTAWMCLDIDTTITGMGPDEWLDALSPEFKDVSFIFHRSASMGITTDLADGWRGHIFVLLSSPLPPPALKQWLLQQNLHSVGLSEAIELGAGGGSLKYPLDITTCQNDKLIYIAPPRCIGFEDPVGARFVLWERGRDTVDLDLSELDPIKTQALVNQKLVALRKSLGLKKKSFRTTSRTNSYGIVTEILTNPDPVTVTGIKEERGFVYLNLNGGDSWGYFFHPENPEVLYNFKGEHALFMRDVSSDILAQYTKEPEPAEAEDGFVPFCFLCRDEDTYYRGEANRATKELAWVKPTGSKAKVRDFLVNTGHPPEKGWAVEEWDLVFDPSKEGYADFEARRVNTYRRTEYMVHAKHGGFVPPIIDRVLSSICVDEATKEHFLNWLAFIFQTREKTNTAWIFQGVQGTGKGVLFSRILVPLLGHQYTHEMTMDRLEDDFNAYLADNILLFIDEAKITDTRNGDRLLNRVKNLVTEPEQHIRGMRRNAVTRQNYSNIILASNYDEIIPMEASDRRFNVAPRQEAPIQLGYDDIARIDAELGDFADYLHSYSVDSRDVRTVMLSEARAKLIDLGRTTIDKFFAAVTQGDLEYFMEWLRSDAELGLDGLRQPDFIAALKRWAEHADRRAPCHIPNAELLDVYQYIHQKNMNPPAFGRVAAKHGVGGEKVRVGNRVLRGTKDVDWKIEPDRLEELLEVLHKKRDKSRTVVPMRAKNDNQILGDRTPED